VILGVGGIAHAQVPGPPPPAKYRAAVRYRILAARDIHVAQYDAMIKHLEGLDFEFNPPLEDLPETNREDRSVNQLTGVVPSAKALLMLQNPSVASIMLIPQDFKLPPEEVHVRLQLNETVGAASQFELYQQVRVFLTEVFGFREAFGYDHHGFGKKPFTRIVGSIPTPLLSILLRDLRTQPANWFGPVIPTEEYPAPLRNSNPILVTEVLPDPNPLYEYLLPPARGAAYLEKISEDLWGTVLRKDMQKEIVRVQLILVGSPSPNSKETRAMLATAAPSFVIDGWFGPVVTGAVYVEEVPRLSAIPQVSALRRVRQLDMRVDPKSKTAAGDNQKALDLSGLTGLHERGFRGKGVRLAIVDTDFRGWDKLVAAKKLPKNTRYVDLAGVTDDDLTSPIPGPPDQLGHGAHCALAAALAAPDAELILLRIEGVDPYEMAEVARYFRGNYLSEPLSRRQDELIGQRRTLLHRRELLLKERAILLKDSTDETELKMNFGFLGPVYGWIFSDRYLHYQNLAYQESLERELGRQSAVFMQQLLKLEKLKAPSPRTLTVVASALNWQDRYPVGSASPLSKWFHLQEREQMFWFQAAGNTRGQAWTGNFRDADANGIMEFAPPETPLKKGHWTREINYLDWQPSDAKSMPMLPLRARVRISLQWREPHDKDYYFRPDEKDYYLPPLADLQLHVIRQRDPDLKILPADAFELVSRSRRLPVRLEHQKTHSIYEHSVEFTADKRSRYAVRIEKQLNKRWSLIEDPFEKRPAFGLEKNLVPTGLRPLGVPTLPEVERNWELRVRLFVDVLDESRQVGRVLFSDYTSEEGSMGLPADSLGVYTVGAADFKGKPLAISSPGPPAFQELGGNDPDLFAYADLRLVTEGRGSAQGSSVAASFAAGWAASLLSACPSPELLHATIRKQSGKVVCVP